MGCTESYVAKNSQSTLAKSVTSRSWWLEGPETFEPPDAEEIRVFYEYVVKKLDAEGNVEDKKTKKRSDRRRPTDHPLAAMARSSSSIGAKNTNSIGVKNAITSTSLQVVASSNVLAEEPEPRDHFLTANRLAGVARELGILDLGWEEIERIHVSLPTDENGKVGQEQFSSAVVSGPDAAVLSLLVQKLHKGFAFGFKTPKHYDYKRPSSENYRMEERQFTDEFAHLRDNIDYSYHNNYTLERQRWQDEVIKSTIVRSSEQPAPWIVFTCGPMGVGKGFCMSWMSKNGFFPLENIVHVDPDNFKLMMPEWPKYVKKGEEAGTLCHMESCFMMEIAQWAAMEMRQNIWSDGSLRNADFYAQVFRDIRSRCPHYQISIMYIYADEAIIRQRIQQRAERTGRNVPEHLIQASLGAMDHALNKLTPLSDFVARIDNSGAVPVLAAFETVDTKGSWSILKDRFARKYDAGEFPHFLAPLPLLRLPEADMALFCHTGGTASGDHRLELLLEEKRDVETPPRATTFTLSRCQGRINLQTSPMSRVNLSSHGRTLAGIPEGAELFFWVFPLAVDRSSGSGLLPGLPAFSPQGMDRLQGSSLHQGREEMEPLMQLLCNGAFCYCSEDGTLVSMHAVSQKREDMLLQFGNPQTMPRHVVEQMKKRRLFQPVSMPYLLERGATKYCWVMQGEIFGRVNVGGRNGGFVYLTKGTSGGLFFPLLSH